MYEYPSDVTFLLTCNYIPGANGKHPSCSARLPLLPPTSLAQSESGPCQFSTANSTTVSAPLELICHQFLFHHPNCFLEAGIGPILCGTTFHYSQELNTWWPPLSFWSRFSSSPPVKKTHFFIYFSVYELWLHNHRSHNDINQSQSQSSLWSCMLIWALMNPIFIRFCRQPCDCELTCIVTQWGEHVLICLSGVHGEKMSS